MSTAVVSTSAALSRPFVLDPEAIPEPRLSSGLQLPFDAEAESILCSNQSTISNQQSTIYSIGNRKSQIGNSLRIVPASHLEGRPAPEMVSSGVVALDAFTGGLPRGCLTEICGPASSGRTTVLLAALAAATRRGEYCVLVDASDAFDPHSVAAAGVELDRLLWVRCGDSALQKSCAKEKSPQVTFKFAEAGLQKDENRLEQLLRATDMLLESGGFGLIALDLCDLPLQTARRIPLTTWFRYRRAVEHTPTVLLAIEQHPIAGSCSSLLLKLGREDQLLNFHASAAKRRKNAHDASRGFTNENEEALEARKKICSTAKMTFDLKNAAHAQLLTGLNITAELIRSRLERKPSRSTSATFAAKTAWAG